MPRTMMEEIDLPNDNQPFRRRIVIRHTGKHVRETTRMKLLVHDYIDRYWQKWAQHGDSPHAEWYALRHNMQEFRGTLPPDALRDSAFLVQEITL